MDRPGVDTIVLRDAPFLPYKGPQLTASHLADDPGFSRAQRHLARDRDRGARVPAAEERYDQPEEQYNEVGEPIEPFHLKRELEEGIFTEDGTYIAYDISEDEDPWLEGLDPAIQGTGSPEGNGNPAITGAIEGERQNNLEYGARERPSADTVEEPPPLGPSEVAGYMLRLAELLQPGESAGAALCRLAGAGVALTKQVVFPAKNPNAFGIRFAFT